jgi:hypothetical protein
MSDLLFPGYLLLLLFAVLSVAAKIAVNSLASWINLNNSGESSNAASLIISASTGFHLPLPGPPEFYG